MRNRLLWAPLAAALAGCFQSAPSSSLTETATVVGGVVLEGETDFGGSEVAMSGTGRSFTTTTDMLGLYEFRDVPYGTYTLNLSAGPYFDAVSHTVVVGKPVFMFGQITLVSRRGSIRGVALAERLTTGALIHEGGVKVVLTPMPADSEPRSTFSDEDGSYAFTALRAGRYSLEASHAGAKNSASVEVTAASITFAPDLLVTELGGFFSITGTVDGSNSSLFTQSPTVTLSLVALGAVQIRTGLSADHTAAGCVLGTAMAFSAVLGMTLVDEGPQTVCVSFSDAEGNETEPQIGQITYDATTPFIGAVDLDTGAQYTASSSALLRVQAFDSVSGLKAIRLSTDGIVFGEPIGFAELQALPLPIEGTNTVWVRVSDNAGNYAEPISANIIRYTIPPECSSFAVVDGYGEVTTQTRTPWVSLQTACTDVNLDGMWLKVGAETSWGPMEPYASLRSFSLYPPTNPNGEVRNIYARVRDTVGHVVDLGFVTVLIDTIAPTNPSLNIIPTITSSATVDVSVSCENASTVELAEGSDFVIAASYPYQTALSFTFANSTSGLKFLYGRCLDAVGNVSSVVVDVVELQ